MKYDKKKKDNDIAENVTMAMSSEELDAIHAAGGKSTGNIGKTPIARQTKLFFNAITDIFSKHTRGVADDEINGQDGIDEPENDNKVKTLLSDVKNCYFIAEKPFAEGGQGKVSRATDLGLRREVAMKSLHPQLCEDDRVKNAFLNEAQLTASLDHPSIIPIHGIYSDEGNGMHLAMKMIRGCTLEKYLESIVRKYEEHGIANYDEPKSLRNRIEIFLRICDAMEYAHSKNIIHRDLKPDNIMIGYHRETYITDWGIAGKVEEVNKSGKISGTPGFMAPEVITEKRADARSDIYSLGVMLYEIVTLQAPFSGGDMKETLLQTVSREEVNVQHRFGCRVDLDLVAIVQKAMEIVPEERYQTVSELAEDLRRYLAHEEVMANPDNLCACMARWAFHHRRMVLWLTMLFLLIGMLCIGGALAREIMSSIAMRYRENAAGTALRRVSTTVNAMEKSIESVEYQIENMRLNFLLVDKEKFREDDGEKMFIPVSRYKVDKSLGKYSRAYNMNIDLQHAGVYNYLGGSVEAPFLDKYNDVIRYMRRFMLDTRNWEKNLNAVTTDFTKHGIPVRTIYFALPPPAGLFVCYPGVGDIPDGYDPTTRVWYLNALKRPETAVWSVPYRDIGERGELVATCSRVVMDHNKKITAVLAVDCSITQLADTLLKYYDEQSQFVLNKAIVNAKGEVIFSVNAKKDGAENFVIPKHVLNRMMRMKYGTLMDRRGRKERLWAFSHFDSFDVIFVECLDMSALIEHNQLTGGNQD